MTGGASSPPTTPREAELVALADALRPELHRYCARLMGSVIEGEDVVQDTFARALVAVDELEETAPLRAWLFRIAHTAAGGHVQCRERLGGLLRYYHQEAA